jgi:hypothetical protein
VLGLTQSLQSIASIVAPLASGWLIEHGALAGWACMAAASMLAGLLLNRRSSVIVASE